MAITKYITVTLEVREAPDFFPAAGPTSQSVFKGAVAVFNFTFSPNSTYTKRVKFTAPVVTGEWVAGKDTAAIGETVIYAVQTDAFSLGVHDLDFQADEVD